MGFCSILFAEDENLAFASEQEFCLCIFLINRSDSNQVISCKLITDDISQFELMDMVVTQTQAPFLPGAVYFKLLVFMTDNLAI